MRTYDVLRRSPHGLHRVAAYGILSLSAVAIMVPSSLLVLRGFLPARRTYEVAASFGSPVAIFTALLSALLLVVAAHTIFHPVPVGSGEFDVRGAPEPVGGKWAVTIRLLIVGLVGLGVSVWLLFFSHPK